MKKQRFTGTAALSRLILRRDRLLLLIGMLIPVLLVMATYQSLAAYSNIQQFVDELTENPIITSILGPIMTPDAGGVVVWRSMGQIVIILGVIMMLMVVRHTRSNEEAGRSEMLRAYVTGPFASLGASLLVLYAASILSGALVSVYLISVGQETSGSVVYGATIALSGCIHAGIGGVAAQFSKDASVAQGIAIGFAGLEIFFLIVTNSIGAFRSLAWLSPMAWHRLTEPYLSDRGLPLFIMVLLIALFSVIAFRLSERRDLGEGLFEEKVGKGEADENFSTPFALAWRMRRNTLLGFCVGVLLIGGAVGGMGQTISATEGIDELLGGLGGMDWMSRVGSQYAFLAIFVYIFALALGLYAVTNVLRLRQEEYQYHTELILAKPVSRMRWMVSNLLSVVICLTAVVLAFAVSVSIVFSLNSGDFGKSFSVVFMMCITKLPVMFVLMGIAAFFYGLLPRVAHIISMVIWAIFVAIEFLWEGGFVSWATMEMSPYAYAHYTTPVGELQILPLIILFVFSVALCGIGTIAFSKRNVGQH